MIGLPMANGWYTRPKPLAFLPIYFTHIDEKGNASIPVLLEIRKRSESALNYPMFINRDPTAFYHEI